jgi:hypothetical protein
MLGAAVQFMQPIAPTEGAWSLLFGLSVISWSITAIAWLLSCFQGGPNETSISEIDISPLLKDPLIMLNGAGEVVYSNMSLDWEAKILSSCPSNEEWQQGEQTFLLRELPLMREGIQVGSLRMLQDIIQEKLLMAEWSRRSEELLQVQLQLKDAFRVYEALLLSEQQRHLAEKLQVEVQHMLEALLIKSNVALNTPETENQRIVLRELAFGLRELLQQIRRLVDGGMHHDTDFNRG